MPTDPEPLTLTEKRAWLETKLADERDWRSALERYRDQDGNSEWRAFWAKDCAECDYHIAILEAELTRIGAPE